MEVRGGEWLSLHTLGWASEVGLVGGLVGSWQVRGLVSLVCASAQQGLHTNVRWGGLVEVGWFW